MLTQFAQFAKLAQLVQMGQLVQSDKFFLAKDRNFGAISNILVCSNLTFTFFTNKAYKEV